MAQPSESALTVDDTEPDKATPSDLPQPVYWMFTEYWKVHGDKIVWKKWIKKYKDFINPEFLSESDKAEIEEKADEKLEPPAKNDEEWQILWNKHYDEEFVNQRNLFFKKWKPKLNKTVADENETDDLTDSMNGMSVKDSETVSNGTSDTTDGTSDCDMSNDGDSSVISFGGGDTDEEEKSKYKKSRHKDR